MTQKTTYAPPVSTKIDVAVEGVFCASPEAWYLQGGSGNFSYEVKEDKEFE